MNNGHLTRAFVAIEMNDEVRNNLSAVQAELKKTDAHVKWIKPENMHLTLSFLGDLSTDTITRICEQLDIIGARTRPLSLTVTGLGTFGKRHSTRIIWAGFTGDVKALCELQTGIHLAMDDLGLSLDDKSFSPHMTIGRVRSARGIDKVKRILETKRDADFGHLEAARVVLMKSVLTPAGPEYSLLHKSPLTLSPPI